MAKRTVTDCDLCGEEIEGDVYEIRVTRRLKAEGQRAEQVSRQDACQACAENVTAGIPKVAPAPAL